MYIYLVRQRSVIIATLLLCTLVGWGFGYIKFPLVAREHLFWLGFIVSTGIFVSVYLVYSLWRIESLKAKFTTQEKKSFAAWMIMGFIMVASLSAAYIMCHKHSMEQKNIVDLQNEMQAQQEAYKAALQNNKMPIAKELINEVRREVRENEEGNLKETTIVQIVETLESFEPYVAPGDSMKKSPERGYMLKQLVRLGMGNESFLQIKKQGNFDFAMLRKANLKNVDLSGIKMNYADLREANLIGIKVNNGDLSSCNLSKSICSNAVFNESSLNGANLTFADFTHVVFIKTEVQSAEANYTNFSHAYLDSATLNYSEMRGAQFFHSSLNGCNLFSVNAVGANFVEADLTGATFKSTNLSQAIFDRTRVVVGWQDSLLKYKNIGAELWDDSYRFMSDTSSTDSSIQLMIQAK